MGKTSKKPTLDERDEFYIGEDVIYFESAVELSDMIEQKSDNPPRKNSKEYRRWIKETNRLIDLFNSKYGHIYTRKK